MCENQINSHCQTWYVSQSKNCAFPLALTNTKQSSMYCRSTSKAGNRRTHSSFWSPTQFVQRETDCTSSTYTSITLAETLLRCIVDKGARSCVFEQFCSQATRWYLNFNFNFSFEVKFCIITSHYNQYLRTFRNFNTSTRII